MSERLRESNPQCQLWQASCKRKNFELCCFSLSQPAAVEYKALYPKYPCKTADLSPKCAKIEWKRGQKVLIWYLKVEKSRFCQKLLHLSHQSRLSIINRGYLDIMDILGDSLLPEKIAFPGNETSQKIRSTGAFHSPSVRLFPLYYLFIHFWHGILVFCRYLDIMDVLCENWLPRK